MKSLQLEDKHKSIVMEILSRYLPLAESEIYVFGSRAKASARKFSDLDLCIKSPIEKRVIRKLKEEFEESNLPFTVDVVEFKDLPANFQNQIENSFIRLEAETK